MSQAAVTDILDEGMEMEEQCQPRIVNVASNALEDAAYWRGKCDGLEITLGYLKDRLDKAEARIKELT